MLPDTDRTSPDDPPRVSRRAALASLAGVAAASVSGCVQRVESVVARDGPNPVSLSIKTPPADDDPRAIRIARYLAGRLQTVGVGTEITPMSHEELLRDVLLNHDFDLYVARHPENADPDFLRPLLHSRFAAEPGWQNPFGYANLSLDESLADQRSQSGETRADTLADVQHAVVRDQPFAVVAFPDEIRTSRSDRVTGWSNAEIHSPLGYLELDPVDAEDETPNEVRMTLADDRATFNRNPLSVEFRAPHSLTDLLYDPPARWVDGELVPWLASSWTWVEDGDGDGGPVADLVLRPDLTWHDGTPLTAEDVAFTYRFLADTSDGSMESAVPAPRFRGRVSLVDSVSVRESGHVSGVVAGGESRTVRVTFKPSSRAVAARAFSVPVLPSHVWQMRTSPASITGLDEDESVTEALVWNNPEPVGSGPLRFEAAEQEESLTFARFEDHFLTRDDLPAALTPFAGGFGFDRLRFVVVPSAAAALELIEAGDADATASHVSPSLVPDIGRSSTLDLHVSRPSTFYHLGFNVRQSPLSNPRFRRALARLLDREHLVAEVFEGYADPALTPLAQYPSRAPDLTWDGESAELAFPGEDGVLDVDEAKTAFRNAGYRYNDEGNLLVQ